MTRKCSECGTILGHYFGSCQPLCLSCSEKPSLHNTSHTCQCTKSQYGPSTSLHKIAKDRRLARVKELAA